MFRGAFYLKKSSLKRKDENRRKVSVLLRGKTSQVILLKAENGARGAFCLDESWLLLPYGQVIRHSARSGDGDRDHGDNDDAGQFSV